MLQECISEMKVKDQKLYHNLLVTEKQPNLTQIMESQHYRNYLEWLHTSWGLWTISRTRSGTNRVVLPLHSLPGRSLVPSLYGFRKPSPNWLKIQILQCGRGNFDFSLILVVFGDVVEGSQMLISPIRQNTLSHCLDIISLPCSSSRMPTRKSSTMGWRRRWPRFVSDSGFWKVDPLSSQSFVNALSTDDLKEDHT